MPMPCTSCTVPPGERPTPTSCRSRCSGSARTVAPGTGWRPSATRPGTPSGSVTATACRSASPLRTLPVPRARVRCACRRCTCAPPSTGWAPGRTCSSSRSGTHPASSGWPPRTRGLGRSTASTVSRRTEPPRPWRTGAVCAPCGWCAERGSLPRRADPLLVSDGVQHLGVASDLGILVRGLTGLVLGGLLGLLGGFLARVGDLRTCGRPSLVGSLVGIIDRGRVAGRLLGLALLGQLGGGRLRIRLLAVGHLGAGHALDLRGALRGGVCVHRAVQVRLCGQVGGVSNLAGAEQRAQLVQVAGDRLPL